MSFVQTLDNEIADLERKLVALRAARAAYEGVGQAAAAAVANSTAGVSVVGVRADTAALAHWLSRKSPEPTMLGSLITSRRSEQSAKLLEEAQALISLSPTPVPTAVVYSHLIGKGFEVRGQKPLNALSAMLSNSGLFNANGRSGWTLKRAADPENAEAADAAFPGQDAPAASFEPRLTSEEAPQRGHGEPWQRSGGGT